ncbi:protein ArsC [Enterococcus mundtii ATCC 882]|nr:protein ArsC [Enterococcus mundtii ATCC 882]EOU12496.1 protein ArsC [Enterococcus mundtii ATCC 882]
MVLEKSTSVEKKKVYFLCTGNSCRSQIAEGYGHEYLEDQFEVRSAGVETHGLNPRAVKVM